MQSHHVSDRCMVSDNAVFSLGSKGSTAVVGTGPHTVNRTLKQPCSRCFLLGPPRGYIARISGQLESEFRQSLETSVEEDWQERN
jgi:hypothetical protein